jgi:hypothetical protein
MTTRLLALRQPQDRVAALSCGALGSVRRSISSAHDPAIAISRAASDAIASTLLLGSVAYEREASANGESYGAVILRLAEEGNDSEE